MSAHNRDRKRRQYMQRLLRGTAGQNGGVHGAADEIGPHTPAPKAPCVMLIANPDGSFQVKSNFDRRGVPGFIAAVLAAELNRPPQADSELWTPDQLPPDELPPIVGE